MFRPCSIALCAAVAVTAPLSAQVATKLKDPNPTIPNRAANLATRPVAAPTIGVRYTSQLGGSQVSILFNPVPNATTYTLRRGTSAGGPFIALASTDFSLNTNSCCEIIDLFAYKTGPGHPLWYIVDAWAGASLLMSSPVVQYDLPPFFKGPIRVEMARTAPNEWTVGWEPEFNVTSYNVSVRAGRGTLELYRNLSIPAPQTQIKLNGLQSGIQYRVEVAATIPWNGANEVRRGMTMYTAP